MWTRCGTIKGIDLSHFEVHPSGQLRNTKTGRVLKGEMHGKGLYPTLDVTQNGRRRRIRFHTILLETYCPRPLPNLECDHRNGDHMNYSIRNLRWVSGPLNISFYKTKGWRYARSLFEARFQNQTLGTFQTPSQAKQAHLEAKGMWQEAERKRIIEKVAKHHGLTTDGSVEALNWS